ncbi:MAG: sialate O-acetylesterase [Methylacidiphilales bacterium]|nr:sialate O-acetylesterase [Candidatus Methylacidiphilales bacterium]
MSALILGMIGSLRADVKMPAIFGDHMVLQQEMTLPVWGTADPGEKVTVTVGAETAAAAADATGKWMVKLPPLSNGSAPATMTVAGKNTLTFSDVLVGDVWVCSGQSNMEFDLGGNHSFGGAANAATAVPAANDPQLRFFVVQKKTALEPVSDVVGKWEVCTPDSAALFSAVGYFFGQELRHSLNRPIGLIGTYWGGTPAQAWTSISGLQKEPALKAYVDQYNRNVANYPKAMAEQPAKIAAFHTALTAWNHDVNPGYQAALKAWTDADNKAKAAGQPEPPKPQPSTPMPRPPVGPDGGSNSAANLFNGMIAPLIPYAIKGTIWYQGESNAGNGPEYRTLFGRMITDWREKWGEGDFPFLFVQLASFDAGPVPNWPYLRESQLKTLSLPNTGMASAVDLGDFHNLKNIHPLDKLDVGLRLALAAKHVAYGQNLVYSGPIYDSFTVEGNAIRVNFTQTGGGLIIGRPPWIDPSVAPWPVDKLTGFEIAAADGNYVPADAKIDGNTVVISSPQVTQPVFVRFAWSNVVKANLYNKEGLPAAPFRTDNQPPPMAPAPKAPMPAPAAPTPALKIP